MSSNPPPCVAWAEKLALRQEDLSPADQATLDAHVQTCPACQAAQTDYHFLDARLRALPPSALKPLPRLSPSFSSRDAGERREVDAGRRPGSTRRAAYTTPAVRTGPLPSLLMKAFSGVLVACLVLALLLLFGTRYIDTTVARPLGTTFFVYGGHSEFVNAVAWSPNGRYIASASWDHTVQVWDVNTRALLFSYEHNDIVDALAWSPDGHYIASGSWDNTVQVWDVNTRTHYRTYTGHKDIVSALAWSPDSRYIASGSWDHTVQVWDVNTRVLSFTYSYNETVYTVAWSPDGHYIAAGGSDRWIDVLNAKKGNLVLTYYGHDSVVNTLAWSPDSRYIASGDRDHIVQVWNAKTGRLLFTYKGHTNEVDALAWSPDGHLIASGSWDNTVQVWQATYG